MEKQAQEIIKFWFEDIDPKMHFVKDESFDLELTRRFADLHSQASRCELFSWRTTAAGRLAEILILDQFSRNMFRNQALAFAYDGLALLLAQEMVLLGADQEIKPEQRSFVYMPYMHSESLVIHEQAVSLFEKLGHKQSLEYEYKHKAIIERFGRYPHRNQILGRTSTPAETEFLGQANSGF